MHYIRCLRVFSLLFLLCFVNHVVKAQVRPGIKFGLSTPDISPKDFIVTDDGVDYYHLFVEQARYGAHAGAFIQVQIGGFFIQPEMLYNSSSIEYRIDSIFSGGVSTNPVTDTYRNLDFPLILGLKAGPVRLGGGPVGHIFLGNSGGFNNYPHFDDFFEKLTWGWQAGVGLDFWKLHIDARYEGNFSNVGDYITFFGKRFDFDTRDNRLIASLGFSF